MAGITAIINVFKRPHTLPEQVAAIRAQSIPPTCIFIWNNGNRNVDLSPYMNDPLFRVFNNSHNFGVWSRFLLATMAPTEHVCIFDDDTIPGTEWFANCMQQMNVREALYGTIGVLFRYPDNHYEYEKRYGWDGPSIHSMPVDIVGHAWFFKRQWLKYFFMDEPQVHSRSRNGEDIHFSHVLQKYANIPTYVPPHHPNNMATWGSMPKTAWAYGCDGTSETGAIHEAFKHNIKNGFRIMKHRQNATSEGDFQYFCNLIKGRRPFALIRPADGEYLIQQNRTLTNIDNWTFTQGGKLAKDLTDAIILAERKCCHIGIPCMCCNKEMAWWYRDRFHINPQYLTFANVFVNRNWKNWINFLKENQVPFTYIGPSAKSNDFIVEKFIRIPEYLVNDWDTAGDDYVKMVLDEVTKKRHSIFMFSCGPIAKIMIAKAWAAHPHNIYLDVGSSLDLYMKGSTNRDYTKDGTHHANLICKFTPDFIVI